MIQRRVHVSDLREHIGRTVSVCGWVNTLRLQRTMQFVIVRDSTGLVQVTHRRDDAPLEALLDAAVAATGVEARPDDVALVAVRRTTTAAAPFARRFAPALA